MLNRFAALAVAAVGSLTLCSAAFGAAALANGALTSAKPTATNPVQRQIQIAADPLGITDFQFSLFYDPSLLFIAEGMISSDEFGPIIHGINGYRLGVRGDPLAPKYAIDPVNGIVSVRGYWPSELGQVPMFEIDVYTVDFKLKEFYTDGPAIPIDTEFEVRAGGAMGSASLFGADSPDFMFGGTMDTDGNPIIDRRYFAGATGNDGILPSTTGTISLFSPVVTPIPSTLASATVFPVVMLMLNRRRIRL